MRKNITILVLTFILLSQTEKSSGKISDPSQTRKIQYESEDETKQLTHLQQVSKTPEALRLLEYLSYLPRDRIPKKLLSKLMGSKSKLESSLNTLEGLITHDLDTVSISNVLQAAVIHSMPVPPQELLSNIALYWKEFDTFLMTDDTKAMLIFQQGLLDAQNEKNYINIAHLSRLLSEIMLDLGLPEAGLRYANEALEAYKEACKEWGHFSDAIRLRMLECDILIGRFHGYLGQYLDAVKSFLTVYETYPEASDDNDLQDIEIYKHLGGQLRHLAENSNTFDGLESYTSQIELLSSNLSVLNSNHPGYIPFYENGKIKWLPDLHGRDFVKSPFRLAERCCQKALLINLSVLGVQDLSTADSFLLMGLIFIDEEDYDRAIGYFHQSVTIKTSIYKCPHPDVAEVYGLLGDCYDKIGCYSEAFKSYSEAFHVYATVFPPDNPELITLMMKINSEIALID